MDPPKLKPSVRNYLAAKGITKESLFPSCIEEFSKARSADSLMARQFPFQLQGVMLLLGVVSRIVLSKIHYVQF